MSVEHPALVGKRCLVLDLDGTLYLGDSPIEPALGFVRGGAAGRSVWYFTNNTSRPPVHTARKLAGFGVLSPEERILNPLRTLVDTIRDQGYTQVWLMATPASRAWMAARLPGVELRAGRDQVQLCAMAYDDTLDYAELCEFAWRLRDGRAAYWTTQPDWNCPHPAGGVPDVGSIAELFRASTGRIPERVFGKPDPSLLAPVLSEFSPGEILIVGDRLYTDFELARRAGVDFALVLTGEASQEDAERLQNPPRWILSDLSAISH